MQGRTVLEQTVGTGEKIQIGHMKPGVYLYQVNHGSQPVQQSRILIAR
jgi:hypothetical protein